MITSIYLLFQRTVLHIIQYGESTLGGAKVKSFLSTHLFKDSLLEHWSVSCESS